VVSGLPRDALVDRAAALEGLAVHDAQSSAVRAIRREDEPDDAPVPAAPRVPHDAANALFRQAGIGLGDEG
jgi:hypothetical protein